MEMTKELRKRCQRVVDCLTLDGEIYALGGSVYSKSVGYIMSTSDLYDIVRALNSVKIPVGRLDSGGSPRWGLTNV